MIQPQKLVVSDESTLKAAAMLLSCCEKMAQLMTELNKRHPPVLDLLDLVLGEGGVGRWLGDWEFCPWCGSGCVQFINKET